MAFETTYNTISKVCKKIEEEGISAYLVGGISAAIQTNTNLYRQNDDLDLMVDSKELSRLIELLEQAGYKVEDKRGIKTGNFVDKDGVFHPADHELNADTEEKDLLGVGIFVYTRENGQVTLNSYSKNEKEGCVVGNRKVIPEELFDLMYSSEKIDYKGTKLMSASKAYTYMIKSRGKRKKDLQDANLLKEHIDAAELEKIRRIVQLELRVKQYFDKYNEKGEIVSTEKVPALEEIIKRFIQDYIKANPSLEHDEVLKEMMMEPKVVKILEQRQDVSTILKCIQKVNFDSKDELVDRAFEISHMYCYSDNFEEAFEKMLPKRDMSFIEGLQGQTYLPRKKDIEVDEMIEKNKKIEKTKEIN